MSEMTDGSDIAGMQQRGEDTVSAAKLFLLTLRSLTSFSKV